MLRKIAKAFVLSLIIALCISSAMAYDFGSKVQAGDTDLNFQINTISPSPLLIFQNLVGNPDLYEQGDVAFLDVDASGSITVGDLRLNPSGGEIAGTKVEACDCEIGVPVDNLTLNLSYSDTFGPLGYDFNDAVYINLSLINPSPINGVVDVPDIRLTKVNSYPAGTTVVNSDLDYNTPLAAFVDGTYQWAFYDCNANGFYDGEDLVYLDLTIGTIPQLGHVSIGDVRIFTVTA